MAKKAGGKKADKVISDIDKIALGRKNKAAKTLFLNEDNYLELQDICEGKGLKPSHIIDVLIEKYLEENR